MTILVLLCVVAIAWAIDNRGSIDYFEPSSGTGPACQNNVDFYQSKSMGEPALCTICRDHGRHDRSLPWSWRCKRATDDSYFFCLSISICLNLYPCCLWVVHLALQGSGRNTVLRREWVVLDSYYCHRFISTRRQINHHVVLLFLEKIDKRSIWRKFALIDLYTSWADRSIHEERAVLSSVCPLWPIWLLLCGQIPGSWHVCGSCKTNLWQLEGWFSSPPLEWIKSIVTNLLFPLFHLAFFLL